MDPMTKMWVSLVGIGLMAVSAIVITIARNKTKGIVKFLLSLVALGMLGIGALCGLIGII